MLLYDSCISEINPSIWLSSILPFTRLEHKLVFVLILALLAPSSLVTLQWQADRMPVSLVPAPATVFWTTTGFLVLAAQLIYLLLYPTSAMPIRDFLPILQILPDACWGIFSS